MLSSEQLWYLWSVAFYWEDWVELEPDQRLQVDGPVNWYLKRAQSVDVSEIALYSNDELLLRFIRTNRFSLKHLRPIISFEVWWQQTLLEKIQLKPGEIPRLSVETRRAVQALLPYFVIVKLRS